MQPTTRIAPLGPLLAISEVQDGDQGSYTCAATNPAGIDRAFTTLTIFGKHGVAVSFPYCNCLVPIPFRSHSHATSI